MSESIRHHHDIAAEQDQDPDDAARELGAREFKTQEDNIQD